MSHPASPKPSPSASGRGSWLHACAAGLDLPGRSLLAVGTTWLVLAAVELVLKSLRIAHYPFDNTVVFAQRGRLLLSELCFVAGLGLASVALTALGERLRVPRLSLALIQLVSLAILLITCIAHGYFTATGGSLDYTLVKYAWTWPRDTAPIVLSAIGPAVGCALVLLPLLLLVPGWVIAHRAPHGTPALSRSALTLRCVALGLFAVLFFVGAGEVRVRGIEPRFVLDPTVALARDIVASPAAQVRVHFDRSVPPRPGGASVLRRDSLDSPYNVVFIILESARADATTPYAPHVGTTPVLAQLAAQSTLVEQAYSVVPHTSKSLVAMLCGFEPRTLGARDETQPDGLPGTCLPKLLRKVGYDTAFFQVASRTFEDRAQLVDNLGFQAFFAGEDLPHAGFERLNYFGYEDAILLGPSQQWLTQRARQPFLAVYLTTASHHPYRSPRNWPKRPFAPSGAKNDYLNALSYVDSVVGKILDQYRSAGLLEQTLFVVLGDHGEGFDEHGASTHDNILYEEGVRIPMLFRVPSAQQRNPFIPGPVNELAVVPTVLDVLGFEPGGGEYAAASVYRKPQQEPMLFASYYYGRCLASLSHQHKLIYYYTDRPPQLFDLQADPGEHHNLAPEQPERVNALVTQLLQWESAVDNLHESGKP